MTNTLTLLGTGYATATNCYNTCFLLRDEEQLLLVDGGGGNTILSQLQKVSVPITSIHHMFLTHAHTDHVLGAVWVVRIILQQMRSGRYEQTLHLWGNDKVLHVLSWICHNTLPNKLVALLDERVQLHVLTDGESFDIGSWHFTAFDIHSTKEKQFGFRLDFPNGTSLTCLGDEPYNEKNKAYVDKVDWLLCEAFCLHGDADRFHPYEKHHSTALDAARLAQSLEVKNLVLYHTEDKTLNTRKTQYTAEAKSSFTGNVFVPNDLESILI